jgi:hypothetical protein
LHQKSKQTKKIKKKSKIMKTTIITIVTCFIFVFSIKPTNAQSMLSYTKSCNSAIGITPLNALGQSYEIKNASGKIILSGKINRSSTFYISTKYLAVGAYTFSINGQALQQFEIN